MKPKKISRKDMLEHFVAYEEPVVPRDTFHILRGCKSKYDFYTKEDAEKALGRMRSSNDLQVYLCQHCRRFHIGHILTRTQRSAARG